ncbi:heterocyst development glycosyltransferase HepC [Thermocoleostomius sinensis]|jgi:lipopolysaccharide/colanic/teichoic acid biosynthesis glycosyltransferase|uniref:Sugar transferase n=1 Tax=Thermocoleostomius sinensis A174 TaxID=2016057 RepID=A0A9E8ZD19_9CYAN|nr:heterocyst development glycosyltransferase HepC [Thermocoleostomius sinensis]WAL59168.1 sugar transferase [Thermocoleostomius sinensis A174]
MQVSNVMLTIAKISVPDIPLLPGDPQVSPLSGCKLKWKRQWLWVSPTQSNPTKTLPALQNEQWFKECLVHSPIRAVYLSPDLDEPTLKAWMNTCECAGKQAFLRLPSITLPQKRYRWAWWIKRSLDWVVASLLLLLLAPIMLLLALLIRLDSSGPILYRQWRVGRRGKLFRVLKFRSMIDGAEQLHHQVMGSQPGLHKLKSDPRVTRLGGWMRKYSLDELPQLINVLRGEMSLVGPRPWALYDAVRIPRKECSRLNALPGITGAWQISGRSKLFDLETVNYLDLEYLRNWTIQEDLRILLMTIPRVISGVNAY